MPNLKKSIRLTLASTLSLSLGLLPFAPVMGSAQAATLTGSVTSISDSRPSATSVSYDIQFDNVTTSSIKCIKVVFSDAATGGSVPTGFDSTNVTVNASSDYVASLNTWTVTNGTNGTVTITDATGATPASASDRNVIIDGITNGSTAETGYFVQFSTFDNVDCASSGVDTGTGTFIYVTGQAVSLSVDSTLSFNVAAVNSSEAVNSATTTVTSTDGTIPFGTVTSGALSIAAHDATVSTNAGAGYTVYIRYTQAPTNGTDSIDDHSGSNAAPSSMSAGTEAFGYTTNDATLGTGTAARFTDAAPEWAAFTTSNAEVAYSGTAVSNETTRIGYAVGISGTTPAGLYQNSTVILTATPSY